MVIHRRDRSNHTGHVCMWSADPGDQVSDIDDAISCLSCLDRMRRTRRSDDHAGLLDLLSKARAQGVRQLEVRPDGSFVALMDPAAPEAPPYRPGIDKKPPTPEEEAAQREADLYTRHAR
jgi:hypothetical protein